MEGEWSLGGASLSSPSMSVPVAEEDPSDIEEDEDYQEEDDASGECRHQRGVAGEQTCKGGLV